MTSVRLQQRGHLWQRFSCVQGIRDGKWNKLPLTVTDIYRSTNFFDSSPFLCSFLTFQLMAQYTGVYCKTGAAGPTEAGCDQRKANSHSQTINRSLSGSHQALHCLLLTRREHRYVRIKELKLCREHYFFPGDIISSACHLGKII